MKKSFIFSLIFFFPIPLIILLEVFYFHIAISWLYTITAGLIVLETIAGIPVRKDYKKILKPTTAIIPAFLPNEKETIFDVLEYYKKLNFAQVILAYNTPEDLPEEEELNKLFWVDVVKVPNSKSKAENLNYVLQGDYVRHNYVAIFDADHLPKKSSLSRALNWLSEGYDAVQGRCVIRNRDNWITKVIAAEFDTVYRLLHNSRFNISNTAIFGGSNCYWKTGVLKNFEFQPTLTEDVDLSLRALSQGVRIAHDPNVISLEEAPDTVKALWKQRVRWSQGWLEVTLCHSKKMLASRHLSLLTRVYWFYNLIYREIFSFLSFSVIFVLICYLFTEVNKGSGVFLATTVFTVASIFFTTLVSQLTCSLPSKYKFLGGTNLLWIYPFTLFKSIITTMAWTRFLVKDKNWMPTNRIKTK